MKKQTAEAIFEQNNPAGAVTRCPYGKSGLRAQLDEYAHAAVNLYGVIPRSELLEIFRRHTGSSTDEAELKQLLLPLIRKHRQYAFYKEYIVHNAFLNDFDQVEHLLGQQAGKPRYVPRAKDFLKYIDPWYSENSLLDELKRLLFEIFGDRTPTLLVGQEIRRLILNGASLKKIGDVLMRSQLDFTGEDQVNAFYQTVTAAMNHQRIWMNNGYSPTELHAIMTPAQFEEPVKKYEARARIGRNDPCPCGSGKKYKKCCALTEDKRSAQLSPADASLFYEIWYGLLAFVNDHRQIIPQRILREFSARVSEEQLALVRDSLWESPELIAEYMAHEKLTPEHIGILQLWQSHHQRKLFFVVEHRPGYSIFLGSDDLGNDRLYAVKGIQHSVATVLNRPLPAPVVTVLLPFKGCIIYDSYLEPLSVAIGSGLKDQLNRYTQRGFEAGLITALP